jgi:hypothetical protein
MENEFKFLRPTGLHAHGWIAQDIHPSGAAGDASLATAEKGRQTAEFQADRFIGCCATWSGSSCRGSRRAGKRRLLRRSRLAMVVRAVARRGC